MKISPFARFSTFLVPLMILTFILLLFPPAVFAASAPSIPLPTPTDSPPTSGPPPEAFNDDGSPNLNYVPVPSGGINSVGGIAPIQLESSTTDLTKSDTPLWARFLVDSALVIGGVIVVEVILHLRQRRKRKNDAFKKDR